MTTVMNDRFNEQLVNQIRPHLENLDLSKEILKFGGDGWLLITSDARKVPSLCCLGVVMAKVFQREMNENTSIKINRIPPLRVSVCSGRDVQVKLPTGAVDWVGDSVRRATRSNAYCRPNQVLIDYTVRGYVYRDFNVSPLNKAKLPQDCQSKKQEEDIPLYILGALKKKAAAEPQAAYCLVYTLESIGKTKEATSTAQQAASGLTALDDWNRLVRSLPDYSSRLEIVKRMGPSGIAPDIDIYHLIIRKSPDYNTAVECVKTMQDKGISPNAQTYNILIDKSTDYSTAYDWAKQMKDKEIYPDVVTFNTLIKKAPNYGVAKELLDVMESVEVKPNVVTYNTLLDKCDHYDAAMWLYDAMIADGIYPSTITYNILIRICPDYPSAEVWVHEMEKALVPLEMSTYSTLILKKAPDFDTALWWFYSMQTEGMVPDVGIYAVLIRRAPSYHEAMFFEDSMREKGIQPNRAIRNALQTKKRLSSTK
ncbi:hypothetical protein ACFLXV_04360 [Chloroflexota bacterium]